VNKAAPESCRQCGGSGQISRSQGFFTVRTACPSAGATGRSSSGHARSAAATAGAGQQTGSSENPAGVDNGSRLRLSSEGEPGAHGGPPGDLYVFIHVQPHEFFERRDNDVVCR